MIARARRRQQLAENRDVQYQQAWPRGRVPCFPGSFVPSVVAFLCTALAAAPASEYVVSDLDENKADAQSQHFAEPAWPKTAPEPEVGITDRECRKAKQAHSRLRNFSAVSHRPPF